MDQPVAETFTAVVQPDGSLVVPSQAVARFNLAPGESVSLIPGNHGRLVLSKAGGVDADRFARWRGAAKDPAGLSTDEYMVLMRGDPDW